MVEWVDTLDLGSNGPLGYEGSNPSIRTKVAPPSHLKYAQLVEQGNLGK